MKSIDDNLPLHKIFKYVTLFINKVIDTKISDSVDCEKIL